LRCCLLLLQALRFLAALRARSIPDAFFRGAPAVVSKPVATPARLCCARAAG
jgi:hypothetical protein